MKRVLLGLALFSCLSPPTARAAITQNISCEASIPGVNGGMLIYQAAGPIDLDDSGQPTRSTETDAELTMTVKKRDRNGQVQILLDRTTLKNFEVIAPDADYSNLPFTRNFRGLSSDDAGLYSVTASQYGLYASLRPFQGAPQQIQIVHYLNAERSVRSTSGTCRIRY